MDAARYWASGGKVSRGEITALLRQQAWQMGMESDALLALLGDESAGEPGEFEIYEDTSDAVEAFMCCGGQWRQRADGRYLGLDYVALGATMVMLNLADTRQALRDVRVMEQAALGELNRV